MSSKSASLAAAVTVVAVAAFSAAVGLAQIPPGPEFRVNTYTTGTQRRPAVAVNSAGHFLVVWEAAAQDGDQFGVMAQRFYDSGAPLGTEFRVNSYTTSSQRTPAVTNRVDSNLVVVWESLGQDGDVGGIFGQRYDITGAPLGGEFRVNTYTTSSQSAPKVTSGGPFMVVWESLGQDGSGSGVFAQRYDQAGAPAGGEFQVNTYTPGFQGNPAAAMSPDGHFLVLWEGESAGGQALDIRGQWYLNTGAPLGGEFRVNTFTPGDQRYPSVSASWYDQFALVWQSEDQDGSGYGVFGTSLSVGGVPSGPETAFNSFTVGAQTRPEVASQDWLNSVVTWESDDDAQDPQGGIFQKVTYSHGGGSAFPDVRVNTTTSGRQTDPAVALYSGYFLIAWTTDQDPVAGLDVYAEIQPGGWIPVELQTFTVE